MLIEIRGSEQAMIDLTRRTVGGVVGYLDITFKNGSKSRCEIVRGRHYNIPDNYSDNDIEKVGVPFDQTSPADRV